MEKKREERKTGEKIRVFFLEDVSQDGYLVREEYTFILERTEIKVFYNYSETGNAPAIQDDWGVVVDRFGNTDHETREGRIHDCRWQGRKEISLKDVSRDVKVACFVMRCLDSSAFDIDGLTEFYDRSRLFYDLLHFI